MPEVMVRVSVERTEEDGRWTSHLHELGAFVHADSVEELAEREDEAVLLLGSTFDSLEDLLAYLDSRRVAHWVEGEASHVTKSYETRTLKVLAGASA